VEASLAKTRSLDDHSLCIECPIQISRTVVSEVLARQFDDLVFLSGKHIKGILPDAFRYCWFESFPSHNRTGE